MPTIPEVLEQAVDLQRKGRLGEAAQLYEAVLRVQPTHPDALHLLGLVANAQKDHTRAVELIQKAINIAGANAVFYANFGVALRFAGRYDEAIEAYRSALKLQPNAPDVLFNLGKSLKLVGNLEEAEAVFRRAIELGPQLYSPWLSLMNLHAERNDLAGAIEVGNRALGFCSASSELCMNLGVMLKRSRRVTDALVYLQRAVELSPNNIEALCKLATALIQLHDIEGGRSFLLRANALAPNDKHVLNGFGMLHTTAGNDALAEQAFSKSVDLHPNDSTALVGLSTPLKNQGKLTQALVTIERGIQLEPENADAFVNRGVILMSLGQLSEAESSFRRAIELRGHYAEAHDGLLMSMQYSAEVSAQQLKAEHLAWDQSCGVNVSVRELWNHNFSAQRPIRLGFVSADLGNHPVGYFTVQMFEGLDRGDFETFIYSDRIGEDPITGRIRNSVHHWFNSKSLSDEQLTDKILEDEIDILFDMSGHTGHNRLEVFAGRAAPIQITWAGYVGTTGIAQMDYLLADAYHVPRELEDLHVEQVLRLPDDYICFEAPEDAPDVSSLPALERGYIVFASMANPAKVNNQVLEVWSEILERVPNSRLLLCYNGWQDISNQERVRAVLAQHGLSDRVDYDQKSGQAALLQVYQQVDMALDTFPYAGGLTTCEALWMGVPTVTLPGERFSSRHSFSHLANAGYHQLVAESVEEYVDIACDLATNWEQLAAMRSSMRSQVASSPMCAGQAFAQNFGKLMREIWASKCSLQQAGLAKPHFLAEKVEQSFNPQPKARSAP